jgi:hypothetical protein
MITTKEGMITTKEGMITTKEGMITTPWVSTIAILVQEHGRRPARAIFGTFPVRPESGHVIVNSTMGTVGV